MITYRSTSDGWLPIANSLGLNGPIITGRSNMHFWEFQSFTSKFVNPRMRVINPTGRYLNLPFAVAEVLDILLGENPGISNLYNKQMCQYINKDTGRYDGHYGDRIWSGEQLDRIMDELKSEPNSRRAVITIHNPAYENWNGVDVACTLSLQFLLRSNHLNLITTMRSEDVYLGFCYDTFTFQFIQEMLASLLNAELGTYYHNVGSLHLYTDDWKKIDEMYPTTIREKSIYDSYKITSMRMKDENLESALNQVKALHLIAKGAVHGEMEQVRPFFDSIRDPYLADCARLFMAEGYRRIFSRTKNADKGLGMVEWRNLIDNEFEDYFEKKGKQTYRLKSLALGADKGNQTHGDRK